MHCSKSFGRTINRSPPASQACAEASATDRSPITESPGTMSISLEKKAFSKCRLKNSSPNVQALWSDVVVQAHFNLLHFYNLLESKIRQFW